MPDYVAIEGDGVDAAGEVVQPGGTSEVSADLKPGTYTFDYSCRPASAGRYGGNAHRAVTSAALYRVPVAEAR